MLATGKVLEIEKLLAEGKLSQRKIAQRVGVSRGIVSAIARGTRPDYEARHQPSGDVNEPLGDVERCPTCGGRVYMPCRLCHVRQVQAKEDALLPRLRRRSRQQAVRRLLVAVLHAAGESQKPHQPAPSAPRSPEATGGNDTPAAPASRPPASPSEPAA